MNTDKWYKADNVAKVFLATHGDRDTRSLRISCTLDEVIEPEVLQKALESTIESRPMFQVRIRRGLFWHYLESVNTKPKVAEEYQRPCPVLYGRNYRGILHYSVTYFGKRINLEVFHALCDGTGAIEFLNNLVLKYLKLKHPGELDELSLNNSGALAELEENSFDQFYGKKAKPAKAAGKAYHIRGVKLPYNQLQFLEIKMKGSQVLSQAKEMGIGVSGLVGARLIMAIYKDMPAVKRKNNITISMPVNLRNYYPSNTSRNFFNNINISFTLTGQETEKELAAMYEAKMKESLQPEAIMGQMDSFQKLEKMVFVRMVPLFIKQPVVRFFTRRENKRVSAVISNLGVMRFPEEMKRHVNGYSALCSHDELFITICSYGDDMVFGVTNAYRNTGVIKNFVRGFTTGGVEAQIQSTKVY